MVAWRCERAARAGVVRGLPVAEAEGLLGPGARIEQERPERDRSALRGLAGWAQRFSPIATPDEPDGLLLDISGCERVFRGEDRLLEKVLGDLAALGFRARVATAPTFGCAWAAARYGEQRRAIISDGGARAAIASFPIRALRIDDAAVEGLSEVGIERIQDLLSLPRSVLPARFGSELLLRLDQALGEAMEAIEPVRPLPPAIVERVFDGPTTQVEAIERSVRELIDLLVDELTQLESGAREVTVRLERADLEPVAIRVVLSRPNRDPAHLWSLIRPRLERVNLGFGVEEIAVGAPRIARLPHRQAERWREGDATPDGAAERGAGELLDALANRLGQEGVRRLRMVESHVPERAFRLDPVMEEEPRNAAAVVTGDRPSVLLDRPAPAEVIALTPDGSVHALRWRGGESRAVVSIGPERISPEWWRTQRAAHERDYFKVQTEDGRWLWLYREAETRRWFVHGVWA